MDAVRQREEEFKNIGFDKGEYYWHDIEAQSAGSADVKI